jgi:GNAT superfamily N-acetyltransferase
MDANIRVRVAQFEDARGMAKVHVDAWQQQYINILPGEFLKSLTINEREIRYRQNLSDKTRLSRHLVAENAQNEIVGLISGGRERTDSIGYDAEIYSLYVSLDAQKHGIAKWLALELAEWMIDEDLHNVMMWILQKNPNQKFLKSLGGSLIPNLKKEEEFGATRLLEIAYGWMDVEDLAKNLRHRMA